MKEQGMLKILNAVRAAADTEYQDRIPEATRNNITQIGNTLITYEPLANKFITTMVNKIGLTIIQSAVFDDPFKFLNKGRLEYGDTIEDLFVSLPKANQFKTAGDLQNGESINPFTISRPDIEVGYERVDRDLQYERTITQIDIKKAFTSPRKFGDFVRTIIDSMYYALEYDKYIMARQLLGSSKIYTADGTINAWKGTGTGANAVKDEEATAKEIIRQLKQGLTNIKWLSSAKNYNIAGVQGGTPRERAILVIKESVYNDIGIDYLAGVFNLTPTELRARIVLVDNFGDDPFAADMVACIIDSLAFQAFDTISGNTTSIPNPKGYYWNYWVTYQGVMAYSRWGNAVAIKVTAPTA